MNQQEHNNTNSSLLVQNPDLLLSCASIDDANNIINNNNSNNNNVVSYDHSYSVMIANTPPTQLVSSFDLPIIPGDAPPASTNTATATVERQFSFDQFIQEDVSLESQREIRDELLDLNILELLQSEEPEMARLIDQASSLDSICNFLPQISVNTTTKVLDNLQPTNGSLPRCHSSFTSMLHELSKASNSLMDDSVHLSAAASASSSSKLPVLFKLEDVHTDLSSHPQSQPQQQQQMSHYHHNQPPPLQMHSSTSFKELCELLSIKKVPSGSEMTTMTVDKSTPSHSQLTKLKLLTPPLTPTDESSAVKSASLKPSRTSMRLFHKRSIKKEPMEVDELVETAASQSAASGVSVAAKRRGAGAPRRKKSESLDSASDSDDKSSTSDSKPLNSSNENSMDLTSYYEPRRRDSAEEEEEDDDEEAEEDESDVQSDSDSENFQQRSGGVKRRLSSAATSAVGRGNKASACLATPIKKESNKEAATRYRLKKISEKDKLFETRFNLEKENDSKRRQIELVQTEINYLKTILVQFILTKSCLNNNTSNNNPASESL